jgi:hypothetical protein
VVFIPPLHPTPPPPAHRCNNPYCLTVYCSISSLNYNVAPHKILFFTVYTVLYIAIGSIGSRLFPPGALHRHWRPGPPSLTREVWTAIRISLFALFCLGLADLLVLFASVPFAGVLLIPFPPRFFQATHSVPFCAPCCWSCLLKSLLLSSCAPLPFILLFILLCLVLT